MGILSGNEIFLVLFIGHGGKASGADGIDGPVRLGFMTVLRCFFQCVPPLGLSLKTSTGFAP